MPDQAITQGSPLYPQAGPAPAPMQLPPIYQTFTQDYARVDVPPEARGAISAIDSLAPVRLDANGIPSVALAAYQRAAGVLDGIKPGCGVDWALLGAIGRVESNHARFGGNVLDASGIARPGIIGDPARRLAGHRPDHRHRRRRPGPGLRLRPCRRAHAVHPVLVEAGRTRR